MISRLQACHDTAHLHRGYALGLRSRCGCTVAAATIDWYKQSGQGPIRKDVVAPEARP